MAKPPLDCAGKNATAEPLPAAVKVLLWTARKKGDGGAAADGARRRRRQRRVGRGLCDDNGRDRAITNGTTIKPRKPTLLHWCEKGQQTILVHYRYFLFEIYDYIG